jgi:hypothetical protein
MFNHPTAVVAASKFLYHAVTVQRLLSSTYFKVFTSQDILGVQLGGALKNPLAIGAGIIEGLELGELVDHYTPIYHHPTQAPPNKRICSSINVILQSRPLLSTSPPTPLQMLMLLTLIVMLGLGHLICTMNEWPSCTVAFCIMVWRRHQHSLFLHHSLLHRANAAV